jgi:hypothetical protein
MQQFNIPSLSLSDSCSIEQVSLALDQKEKLPINITPWPDFNYLPNVAFAIAHDGDKIFLKYYVEENTVIAVHRKTNGPVYKDSCVEFFIAFDDEKDYYNIEFNCAGSCHVGYGSNRENRRLVPPHLIRKIKYQASFKSIEILQAHIIKWELIVIIPISIFYYRKLATLKNQLCRVNFYKCGDELPQPHYVCWNNIFSAAPNFHLSEFFRSACFKG